MKELVKMNCESAFLDTQEELNRIECELKEMMEELDEKNCIIEALDEENRRLKAELCEIKKALEEAYDMVEKSKEEAYNKGIESVVEDIVYVLNGYGYGKA